MNISFAHVKGARAHFKLHRNLRPNRWSYWGFWPQSIKRSVQNVWKHGSAHCQVRFKRRRTSRTSALVPTRCFNRCGRMKTSLRNAPRLRSLRSGVNQCEIWRDSNPRHWHPGHFDAASVSPLLLSQVFPPIIALKCRLNPSLWWPSLSSSPPCINGFVSTGQRWNRTWLRYTPPHK